MNAAAIFHYVCATFRLALVIWGICLLVGIVAGYALAALSGAGESGSAEEDES